MRKFFATLAVAALLAGYTWHVFTNAPEQQANNTATVVNQGSVIGQRRPDFALPDLDGKIHRPGEWDGKVVLVNFWATWCPPCRHEIPGFVRIKEKYATEGFDVVGIAIDSPEAVREFSKEITFNYTLLHGQADASALSRAFGDNIGALPFSALLNRKGEIVFTKAGELTESSLEAQLESLL